MPTNQKNTAEHEARIVELEQKVQQLEVATKALLGAHLLLERRILAGTQVPPERVLSY